MVGMCGACLVPYLLVASPTISQGLLAAFLIGLSVLVGIWAGWANGFTWRLWLGGKRPTVVSRVLLVLFYASPVVACAVLINFWAGTLPGNADPLLWMTALVSAPALLGWSAGTYFAISRHFGGFLNVA
jgi:hypothetical protein